MSKIIPFIVMLSLTVLAGLAQAQLPPGPWGGMDQNQIAEKLENDGIEGWVHAANPPLDLYVFSTRNPDDFFQYELYPMISDGDDIDLMLKMMDLKRHDRILIKGRLVGKKAPQRHIRVESLELLEPYKGMSDHDWSQVKVPEDFPQTGEIIAKVHAVADSGRILIIEKGPLLFPVFVNTAEAQELAATFFRNDKIKFHYQVRKHPGQPVHLSPEGDQAFEVIDKIEVGHGSPFTLKGSLVMYPQSPQIIFNVFAIQQLTGDEVERNFTLINFENPEEFKAIREKLQKAWDEAIQCAKSARNKWVNPQVIVEAKGLKNVVSPNQANPQILLDTADQISIESDCR